MIFQKHPKKSIDIKFNIGSESIEIVQEYTYLGTRLTPTGNFTLALEHLKEKALHAFSSIRKRTILNKLNPNTASQIFDTMVFPILSYNSEVWGMYTKQDFFHCFPKKQEQKDHWIAKIHRDEEILFTVTDKTHVCSLRLQNSPVFAYSSTSKQSNKMSGARLETETDTWERR